MGKDKNTADNYVFELSAYITPVVEESINKNKEWVEYKVKDHVDYSFATGFYHYLSDKAKGSTTNGAIIKGFKRFIYGKGLSAINASRDAGGYAQMKSLISNKDLKKAIGDRKRLMMAALQVTYNNKKVTNITHFPMNTLLPEKMSDKGDIEAWYYHPDWKKRRPSEKPERIPSFGFGNKTGNEIYIIRDEGCDSIYFGEDEGYTGALAYAAIEEEIGDFLINDVMNQFSGTKIINFNNGIPEEEKRKKISKDVIGKVTGATGRRVIVSFQANEEQKTTIDNIPLDNAPDHYQFLADECESKLLIGHLAPSELLGFNKEGQGFSNNAEELINKMRAFSNYQVKPIQQEFTDALDEILAINDIILNLYFIPIDPLEFIDTTGMDAETKEEETGMELSEQKIADTLIGYGEDIGQGWELISEQDVDYDSEDQLDIELEKLNKPTLLQKITNLVRTGTARPNSKSQQDETIEGKNYKVRYSYGGALSLNSRPFCVKMKFADKLYRKEDIIQMEKQVVNEGWGARGADKYSIWLYKGGGNCHHKWVRKTFKFTGVSSKGDTRSPLAPTVSTNKAEREGYRVRNPKEVAMKPKDMPNEGFLPSNKQH